MSVLFFMKHTKGSNLAARPRRDAFCVRYRSAESLKKLTRTHRLRALLSSPKRERASQGVPSIKQVFLLKSCRAVPWCRRYKQHEFNNRREQAPALRQKEYEKISRTPFHTPCLARYSVLHLLGILSGGNKPPLCKGRWLAQARRRDCKS